MLDGDGHQEVLNCLHLQGKGMGGGGGDLKAEEFHNGGAKEIFLVAHDLSIV